MEVLYHQFLLAEKSILDLEYATDVTSTRAYSQ